MNRKQWTALVIALLLLLLAAAPVMAATERYVYKSSGKHTSVYAKPGGAKIGSLASGTAITVKGTSGSYTKIAYGSGTGYVRSSNVVNNLPGKSKKTTTSGSGSGGYEAQDTLDALNAEYRSMRQMNGYTVTVRPAKPSGYVNLRFGPSTSVEVMDRLYQGYPLEVLAKGRSWLQVRDPATGRVGYISTRYTSELN